MLNKRIFPFNLQFFAADGAGSGSGSTDGGNNDSSNGTDNQGGNATNNDDNGSDQSKTGKTFTQEQVNQMMAREKRQGKQSILKELGFETEDDAKNSVKLLKALLDSQKSEEELSKEEKEKADKAKVAAEERANKAEAKLACIINGVDKDSVDDVLVIAMGKVTEDKNLETVIGEMKKEKRYASFFNGNENGSDESGSEDGKGKDGTGGNPGHTDNDGDDKNMDYGARLAKKFTTQGSSEKKKTYF